MSTKNPDKVLSKKSQDLDAVLELPKGVSAKFEAGSITVTGPLGKVTQDFSKIPVGVVISGL
jgi:ribosomal protein L6P/L9E